MKTKDLQNATQNMAKNESLQKAFSDGRIHVMNNHMETKRSILQNTLHEQKMMIDDPKLSEQLLGLNINLNQMMNSTSGNAQLTQSTLKIMDGINKDFSSLRSFIHIQNESRKKGVKDKNLQNQIFRAKCAGTISCVEPSHCFKGHQGNIIKNDRCNTK